MDSSCDIPWLSGPSLFYIVGLATALTIALVTLLVVYLLDVNYFLRCGAMLFSAYVFRKPLKLLEPSEIYARVLPFDADVLLTHMNNARVFREYDFGRLDLWARTGLAMYFTKKTRFRKGSPFVVGQVIRYRRPLHMFTKYKIVTRVVYWEGKMLYHEHKIITLRDNITRCISYSMAYFPFKIENFVQDSCPEIVKPEPPRDLAIWMKYNEANSSRNVKKKETNSADENDESDQWLSTDYASY